ncbi:MAG: ABC transporter permease [Thermoplasmata archaeon]|nr:MAG: ABC transporter permease [Thermoplasmata archaeon]
MSHLVRLSDLKEYAKLLLSNRVGVIGLALIIPFIFIAVFAPYIAITDPMKVGTSEEILLPPCPGHPLGTDDMGRDVWSLLVYGSRVSMLVGFLAALIGIGIGSFVGLVAGYYRGIVEEVIMRLVDIVMVIPTLPLMIVLAAVLGPSLWNVIIAISVVGWPSTARIVRSQVLSVRERPYVEAARCLGAGDLRLMFSEILPNVVPIIFAETILWVSEAIYSEAVLSFLGLGDPMHASWGMMLHFAFESGVMSVAWWWVLPPGMCIALVVLGFSLFGSAVNEILNPRYRELLYY